MSKIELTIAPDYVPTWTIVDAIRELFQNALDQETQHPANKASWSYDAMNDTLTICNKTSKLTAGSLLLGKTTKEGDKNTIGQFGEGYKIATLVLLRNNKQVTFYNYGAREIWRPRFVKSRRFGTDILTFFIETPKIWESVPSADLTIEVKGITADEYYKQIVPSNLHLRHDYEVLYETKYGNVINLPGKVFVNGLFVRDYELYKYGYNFKPEHIRLDRDRKMVSDFDLRWMASKMWSDCADQDHVMKMIVDDEADVAYLPNTAVGYEWNDAALDHFRNEHGPKALPVKDQDDLSRVPAGYHGVIVPDNYCNLITFSSDFKWPTVKGPSTLDNLQNWFDRIKDSLTDDEQDEFNKIMEELKNGNL